MSSRYAVFTGCTIPVMQPHLEAASRKVLAALDIELVDFDFNCCPTSSIREVDGDAWLVMAARNLALAEEAGLDIITLCNGCTQSLKEARHILEDEERRADVNAKLATVGHSYAGKVQVRHFADVLHGMREELSAKCDDRLEGVNVAAHPGCHIVRPSDIMQFDDPERPVKYDELIAAIGATPIDYPIKTLCCGFKMFDADRAGSSRVVMDKVEAMSKAGADLIITGCPSCFTQFDRNQLIAQRTDGRDVKLPVLFFTQLVGLALGFSEAEMELGQHRVKVVLPTGEPEQAAAS